MVGTPIIQPAVAFVRHGNISSENDSVDSIRVSWQLSRVELPNDETCDASLSECIRLRHLDRLLQRQRRRRYRSFNSSAELVKVRQHVVPRCVADVSSEIVDQARRLCSIWAAEITIKDIVDINWANHHGIVAVVVHIIDRSCLE